jgi:hypothetical protein
MLSAVPSVSYFSRTLGDRRTEGFLVLLKIKQLAFFFYPILNNLVGKKAL